MGLAQSQMPNVEDDDTRPFNYRPVKDQMTQVHRKQVRNAFGAYVYQVDDIQRVQRFLILGCEGGTYMASEQQLKRENAKSFDRLIADGKGEEVVKLIRDISVEGRSPKQGPIMFGLALCARSNDPKTKKAAYECLNEVCRIPTHLFMFVGHAEEESNGSGWGRAHRRAIARWYEELAEKKPKVLAVLVTKYKQRESWSHRDVLRLAHIKPKSDASKLILRYIIKGIGETEKLYQELGNAENLKEVMDYLIAVEKAKKCTSEETMVRLIENHKLVREHVPTALLKSVEVWKALLKNMPMTAMIRNLGKMSSMNLIEVDSIYEKTITEKLRDVEALRTARVHPFNVLVALNQYKKGHGEKGGLKWTPNKKVLESLDAAFLLSFKVVPPTGKKYLLAIDISGSMSVPCIGTSSISCRDAASAMMMVTLRTEDHCEVVAFSHELRPLNITKEDSLGVVIEKSTKLPFGSTDCALPMIYAMDKNKKVDVFIVYTDSETWFGKVHPFKALQDYRVKSEIFNAKLIVVGLCSNGFTIADPDDPNMLDVVGFDSGAVEVMNKFIMEAV